MVINFTGYEDTRSSWWSRLTKKRRHDSISRVWVTKSESYVSRTESDLEYQRFHVIIITIKIGRWSSWMRVQISSRKYDKSSIRIEYSRKKIVKEYMPYTVAKKSDQYWSKWETTTCSSEIYSSCWYSISRRLKRSEEKKMMETDL